MTLDQLRSVVHNDPVDPDEPAARRRRCAANLVTLTATITDGDGDTNTAVANIGGSFQFEDDGPSISVGGDLRRWRLTRPTLRPTRRRSFAGLFTPAFGADGFKDADNNDVAGCGRDHLCAGRWLGHRAGRHADQFGGEPSAQRRRW